MIRSAQLAHEAVARPNSFLMDVEQKPLLLAYGWTQQRSRPAFATYEGKPGLIRHWRRNGRGELVRVAPADEQDRRLARLAEPLP